jgi:hypothetical protein
MSPITERIRLPCRGTSHAGGLFSVEEMQMDGFH